MQFHTYGAILLLLSVPWVSAARVRSKAVNKDLDEEVYVPTVQDRTGRNKATSRFGESEGSEPLMPAWDRHLSPVQGATPLFGVSWRDHNHSDNDSAAFMAAKPIITCATAVLQGFSARVDSIGGGEPALFLQVSESASPDFDSTVEPDVEPPVVEPDFDVNSQGEALQDSLAALELKRIRHQTHSLASQLAKVKTQLLQGTNNLMPTGEVQNNLTYTYTELVSLKLEGAQLLEKVNVLMGLAQNIDTRAAEKMLEARFESKLSQSSSEAVKPSQYMDDQFWENYPGDDSEFVGWDEDVPSDC